MTKHFPFYLILLISVISCSYFHQSNSLHVKTPDIPSTADSQTKTNKDTLEKYNLQKKAKKGLELIEIQLKKDTLELISTADFLYYPFGRFDSISDFIQQNDFLQKYHQEKTIESNDNINMFKLIYKDNFLVIFKSPDSKRIEIIKARISDPNINLVNKLKAGINKEDFLNIFFNNVDGATIQNISVIKFISGLTGVWNNYYFENNKLSYYTFDTDYQFEANKNP
jgi:hypothetical protein